MKHITAVLVAFVAFMIPSLSQARTIEIELFHSFVDSSYGKEYYSARIDTTDFRAEPGDTIRAIVPDWPGTVSYYGRINLSTTNGDSIIIPEGVKVFTNAFWYFKAPARIGRPGGEPVLFYAIGLRPYRTSLRNEVVDRRAGIGVTKSLVGYNLSVVGFNSSDAHAAIRVAYGASAILYDSKTINNRHAFQVLLAEDPKENLPDSGVVTIKTFRHAFEDSLSYLYFDADKGVAYADEGSRFGSQRMGIDFSGMPFSNPETAAAYIEAHKNTPLTFKGSISEVPINTKILNEWKVYIRPTDGPELLEMLTKVISARVIVQSANALAADFNNDGVVALMDFILFIEAFNKPGTGQRAKFDLNADGMVNFMDFSIFVESWGKTAASKRAVTPANEDDLALLLAIIRDRPELLLLVEYILPRGEYVDFYHQLENRLPEKFSLAQNFPNPFNPTTTINYSLPNEVDVRLIIYSLTGQTVRTLVATKQLAGRHEINWNGTDDSGRQVSTGIYIYQITAGSYIETRRMLLLK